MSEDSLERGPVSGLGRLRRGKTGLLGGLFKVGPGCWLHSGWSSGALSVGPEPKVEIPVSCFVVVAKGHQPLLGRDRRCSLGNITELRARDPAEQSAVPTEDVPF